MGSKVLITGATGFIATHIIDLLIKSGYEVIGTVRTDEKGENITNLFGKDQFKYEIVKDLGDAKQDYLNIFTKHPEIEVVIHTASPVFYTDKIKELIVDPAVEGTRNILETIKEKGSKVHTFVYTSSIGAVLTLIPGLAPEGDKDESSWNLTTWEYVKHHVLLSYMYAKAQAERLIWKFDEEVPNVKVVSINPGYVFGPQVFNESVKSTLNSSNEVINTVLRDGEKYTKTTGHWIDVRDVAKAHLYAIEKENTKSERLILLEGTFTEQSIIDIINKDFPQLKGKISTGVPGSDAEHWKGKPLLKNEKTREILGFEFIPLEKSVKDTVQQLLDNKIYS